MTTLTPEQRLRAYEYVLNHFDRSAHNEICLCDTLERWMKSENMYPECKGLFPEFEKRKPERTFSYLFWFPLDDIGYLMRVLLILDCIEEVKGLIRK